MKSILIGATGFVGSNLRGQMYFDALASSRNIAEFNGQSFDIGVISAGDARKWYANQHPEEDREHIDRLMEGICGIDLKRVIHFSTVDVYAIKQGTELDLSGNISIDAYGSHRYLMEQTLRKHFADVVTVRLPGLYGEGLKKNLIFDISQKRALTGFNPDSTFQWFDLFELKRIIDFVEHTGVSEINVCTEPLSVKDLLSGLGISLGKASSDEPLVKYDIRSIYANAFSDEDNYLYSKKQSLNGIKIFLSRLSGIN
jgi:nucleoside-diphosphate-sugar epimerase